jgi:hypothetical protein
MDSQYPIMKRKFTLLEKKIDLARKEWLLSADGVVKGL